jgi:hypothetical protein
VRGRKESARSHFVVFLAVSFDLSLAGFEGKAGLGTPQPHVEEKALRTVSGSRFPSSFTSTESRLESCQAYCLNLWPGHSKTLHWQHASELPTEAR